MSPRGPPRSPLQTTSPLSPTRMDSLAIPSQQRRRPSRSTAPTPSANSLRLPSLPRFHPANFPSHQNSVSSTPSTNPGSPHAPQSPGMRQYSEAQQQLYLYQRELLAANARNNRSGAGLKPASPRLAPLGSPGPVTPLELEQQKAGSYFVAGTGSSSAANQPSHNELVERLIAEEAQRRGDMVPQIRSRPVASR